MSGKLVERTAAARGVIGRDKAEEALALANAIGAALGEKFEPIATSAPSISGVAESGETLTGVHGQYLAPPTSYTYRWLLNGSAIAGATAQSYVVQAGDTGEIVFEETPTNAIGTGAANVSASLTLTPAPTRQSIGLMTDLDSDIDDVVAQALLFDLLDASGASLAYVSVASRHPDAAHAQRVLLNAAGHSSVPVGQMETPVSANSTSLYDTAVANLLQPKIGRTEYPSSVSVMRQALAAMPAKSHKIITTGNLTDYAALLQSPADAYSPLTGAALVAAKVISVHAMGGRFPSSAEYEANANGDEPSANYAAANTPVPIYWAQYSAGGDVMTRIVTTRTAATDPYGVAWDAYGASTRASWDSIPVIHALLGLNGWFDVSEPGDVVFSAGTNWIVDPVGKNYYLTKTAPANTVRDYINGRVDAFMARYGVLADNAPSDQFLATFDGTSDGTRLETIPAQTGQSWKRAAASVGYFEAAAATGTIYSTTSPTLYEVADYKTGADLNIDFDARRIDNESGTLHVRFHVVDDTNYLTIGHSGSTGWRIGQKINGISTTLATTASNMAVGQNYAVRAEVRGGLVDLIVNGTVVLTDVAIPALPGRKFGLEGNWTMSANKSVHFDRVAVETIASAA